MLDLHRSQGATCIPDNSGKRDQRPCPGNSGGKGRGLGAKVKGSLLDAKDVAASAYRVIAERGVVYLMGRVTEREAARAVEIVRAVSGVVKVVRVLDIITEEELAAMTGKK